MSPAEREAIRARTDAATAGPWSVVKEVRSNGQELVGARIGSSTIVGFAAVYVRPRNGTRKEFKIPETEMLANAHAIAAAREDVPRLLAEVERLSTALYDEAFDHAACLSIAEGAPIDGFVPTRPSQRAVLAQRADNERLRKALGLVMWMAERYAEAGGSNGPEMREWREAKALANGAPVADVAPGTTNGAGDGP